MKFMFTADAGDVPREPIWANGCEEGATVESKGN